MSGTQLMKCVTLGLLLSIQASYCHEIVGGRNLSLTDQSNGSFTLEILLGGVMEVFHLTMREERAGMWVAGEKGELRSVIQEVSIHFPSLPATAMTRQFLCTRT